jgi:hypothetical protein
MAEITQKLWNGRIVAKEMTFNKPEGLTFGAMYQAEHWLKEHGFSYGSSDAGRHGLGSNPVAIKKGPYDLPQKWHNFRKEDKLRCDGVMIASDWREGDVRVILFQEKLFL